MGSDGMLMQTAQYKVFSVLVKPLRKESLRFSYLGTQAVALITSGIDLSNPLVGIKARDWHVVHVERALIVPYSCLEQPS